MRPADHELRLARARPSLDGLSVGDAFGERFFAWPERIVLVLTQGTLPPDPWESTDDTGMAISLVEGLAAAGRIDSRDGLQKALALPLDQAPSVAAEPLGTGRPVLSWDTVP